MGKRSSINLSIQLAKAGRRLQAGADELQVGRR